MKKCNFFPVLLLALFMLLGFDSNAQYKSIPDALAVLKTDVNVNPLKNLTATSTGVSLNSSVDQRLLFTFKQNLADFLIKELQAGSEVEAAFAKYEATRSSIVTGTRKTAYNKSLTYYKGLLVL